MNSFDNKMMEPGFSEQSPIQHTGEYFESNPYE